MVISPSGVRKISVPRYEIVAISLLDIPSLKNGALGDTVDEDDGDVDVSDEVVVLVRSCANLNSPNENILNTSSVEMSTDGIEEELQVFVRLDIEPGVPLTVFGVKGDLGWGCVGHGKIPNELP